MKYELLTAFLAFVQADYFAFDLAIKTSLVDDRSSEENFNTEVLRFERDANESSGVEIIETTATVDTTTDSTTQVTMTVPMTAETPFPDYQGLNTTFSFSFSNSTAYTTDTINERDLNSTGITVWFFKI